MKYKDEKFSLISLSLENFGIFHEKVELSLASRKLKGRTFKVGNEDVLQYGLIFGENASGKSTIVRGLHALQTCVRWSVERVGTASTFLRHNRLRKEAYSQPVRLSLVMGLGDQVFEYGFAYDHKSNAFIEEYLHQDRGNSDNPVVHFEHKNGQLRLSDNLENRREIFENKKRPDALFITAASLFASDKNDLFRRVFEHICNDLYIIGANPDRFPEMATRISQDQNLKERVLEILRLADFSIVDLVHEKTPIQQLPPILIQQLVKTGLPVPEAIDTIGVTHDLYDGQQKLEKVVLNIGDESEGTRHFLNMLDNYVDALEKGKVIVLDEFDVNLHPRLTKLIVQLFQDHNPNNAQLIATTHDATLLDLEGVTKYHIYFTQKLRNGSAELYSLAEFDVRNSKKFADDYLAGVFGAVPNIRLADVAHDAYGQES